MYYCDGCNRIFDKDGKEFVGIIEKFPYAKVCKDCIPKSRICIKCGKEIKNFDPTTKFKPENGIWFDGIVSKISAGYGSNLDGDMYIIAICDDCIRDNKDRVEYVGNYMEDFYNREDKDKIVHISKPK